MERLMKCAGLAAALLMISSFSAIADDQTPAKSPSNTAQSHPAPKDAGCDFYGKHYPEGACIDVGIAGSHGYCHNGAVQEGPGACSTKK
jgi:hypothetical protein